MKTSRIMTILAIVPFCAVLFMAAPSAAVAQDKIEVGGELPTQDWFAPASLDLSKDLEAANAQGKRLAIIWEQFGCPYCADMHKKVDGDAKLKAYIQDNFLVVQMNLWGTKPVTDFDGEVATEMEFAGKYGVQFTPTLQFFPESLDDIKGKKVSQREVFRLPGFLHFSSVFVYVKDKAYDTEPNFQRFILARIAARNSAK